MRLRGVTNMPIRSIGSINPGDVDAGIAARAARRIEEYLDGHPDEELIEAIGEVGTEDALVIPRPTAVMLAQILDLLAQGRGVQIFTKDVELTTQHAADMLNVSRPYLIGLLESGKIPFRKVGRHRRIRFEDLMAYKRRDDLERRVAADKLAELTEELDLY
jgi:excisionase family DNA binding protein